MTNTKCLNENYSTTRLITKEKAEIINNHDNKFKTVLFLPEEKNRKGEGGLRTKNYFKKSFENKPLISIITVVYNGEKFLEETIKSVINQTYDNVEYIIIDGGSSDGTIDIIKKYEDYIDYWVSEKDNGIYDAMNKGIDLATGIWINFMNAGDLFFDNTILNRAFENQFYECNIIYGDVETIYEGYSMIHKAGDLNNLYKSMQFSHQSTFFNSIYHKQNKYNEYYKLSADYHNIVSLYEKGVENFKYISFPIAIVNTLGVSETNIFKSVYERWLIIKEIKRNDFFITLYYMLQLSKQFIKIKFFNNELILKYRQIKYFLSKLKGIN